MIISFQLAGSGKSNSNISATLRECMIDTDESNRGKTVKTRVVSKLFFLEIFY